MLIFTSSWIEPKTSRAKSIVDLDDDEIVFKDERLRMLIGIGIWAGEKGARMHEKQYWHFFFA